MSQHTTQAPRGAEKVDRLLLRTVDVGLACCVLAVPFLMGGRHAVGQLALVTLAVVVALAWIVRQSLRTGRTWRWSGAEPLLAAGAILLVAQLVPWPQSLLSWLSPHTSEILPLWSSDADPSARLGVWSQISLTPAATRAGLALFLAYALLFLVAVQRVRAVEDVERCLRLCALSAVLMAAFGLIQLLTSNGKFFWFYEHPFTSTAGVAKGSFTNRNHFAHFLALGVGPLIWWVQGGRTRRTRIPASGSGQPAQGLAAVGLAGSLRVIAVGIVLFALFLSLSRGGTLVALLAAAISAAVCWRSFRSTRPPKAHTARQPALNRFRTPRAGASKAVRFLGALAGVALLTGLLLAVFGYGRVSTRLETLFGGSLEAVDSAKASRRTIWKTVVKAIPDFAVLGSGVGSHRDVYPMYLDWRSSPKYYSHAENGYLQVALETGFTGLALLLTGIAVCAFWCVAGLRAASCRRLLMCLGAVSAGLAASVVHSVVDFVWYVPACMAVVAVLAACACRLWQLACAEKGRHVLQRETRNDPRRAVSRDSRAHPVGTPEAREIALARPVGAVLALVLLGVGTWMVAGRIGPAAAQTPWDRHIRSRRAAPDPLLPSDDWTGERSAEDAAPLASARQFSGARGGKPPVAPLERPARDDRDPAAARVAALREEIEDLKKVVRRDPDHAVAHQHLAEAYIRLFHHVQQTAEVREAFGNLMPLSQIRDAVFASRSTFSSQEAYEAWLRDWLLHSIGPHSNHLRSALKHTRRALDLCPLWGDGYLYLAELCFLDGKSASTKAAYVAQALKVRPFDGNVLFHAGNEAWLAGDPERWWHCWRSAFHKGPVYQQRIVDALAGRAFPEDLSEEISALLSALEPDYHGLKLFYLRYRQIARPHEMRPLLVAYARAAEAQAEGSEGEASAGYWAEAMTVYQQLQDPQGTLRCGRRALQGAPNSHRVRRQLALSLADLGQLEEAEEHLRWLLKRKPDAFLEKRLRQIRWTRIHAQAQATAAEATGQAKTSSRPPPDSPGGAPPRKTPIRR